METPAALPRPPELARRREAAEGAAQSRVPFSSAASAVRDAVLHSYPPKEHDLPSHSFPPVPCEGRGPSVLRGLFSRCLPPASCMGPGQFCRSLTPAGRKERESTALAGHGLSAPGVPPWS